MFNSITWESFLYAGVLLVGGYYAITTLLLYSQEITAWFRPKPLAFTTTSTTTDEETTINRSPVMGSVSKEEDWLQKRTALVDSEDIVVDEETIDELPETITAPGESDLLNGSVADLTNEITALLNMAAEYNSSKEEVSSLFIALFERYPHLKGTTYAQAINKLICEKGKTNPAFNFNPLEVRSWWETSINS